MEFEIKPKEGFTLGFSELFQYRELFYFFAWRDIKVKYKQTFLGVVWVILQPLLMTLLFTIGFGRMVSQNASLTLPYPLFALSGLIIWGIFSSGVSSAGNSMVANSNIIKKIYFPRLIIPCSAILVSLFDFVMALIVFFAMLLFYQITLNVSVFILALIGSMLLAAIATFGTGVFLSALNVKYRDFRYVIPFLIQALMFSSTVLFPSESLPTNELRFLFALNPMYAPIELFRYGIQLTELNLELFVLSLSVSCALFVFGIYYFRKTEDYFADLA